MNKKAATHVVAFLLFDGASKMGSRDIDASLVDSYLHGGMKASDTISFSFGFPIGSWGSRR